MGADEHWNDRYRSIGATEVSWYEARPTISLDLLDALEVTPEASVIDIGGGASTLVDHLVRRGHHDIAVLDVAGIALEAARRRLGDPEGVTWLEVDLLDWRPSRRWSVWHDRAMLHFLLDPASRSAYAALLRRTVDPGGAFVIATFAPDGPTHCSGLPVCRQAAEDLVELLGDVDVVERRRHVHRTPAGVDQPFTWLAGRLASGSGPPGPRQGGTSPRAR
jgi:trans-aconitate methyltransferase